MSAPVISSNGGGARAGVRVAENRKTVTTVTATDADRGDTRSFSISGGADAAKFRINAHSGALAFVKAPDFEAPTDAGRNNVYDVQVEVTDRGGRSDTQAIAVTVGNTHDAFAPVITSNGGRAKAAVNVAENSKSVTKVVATDADRGDTRSFSIAGGADAAKFRINASTGALSFVKAPNFEAPTDKGKNNVYDVQVKVTDSAGRTDQQAIAVKVTNVNDAPVITSNGGRASAALSVAENSKSVSKVVASDADRGDTRTFSISGGTDAAKFKINASTGALSFVKAPNFEAPTDKGKNNVYDVQVKATDSGGRTDQQAIAVTVSNVNEKPPVITSNGGGASAAVIVAENSKSVTTVVASDADRGDTRTFSISGGADAAKFKINANTGALVFKTAPNFEVATDTGGNNVYNLQVKVTDRGGRTDLQAIAVTVSNVNEKPPVIISNGGGASAAVIVAENSTVVTTVRATDGDAGDTRSFSVVGGADAARFTIDAGTGVLAFAAAPNFEVPTDQGGNNVYDVQVQVTDGGGRTDVQSLAVTVSDVNDQAPVITSNGGGASAALSIDENGTAVTTVIATDGDAGDSRSFSIVGGADAARFTINGSTGALAFVAAPNFEAPTDADGNNIYDVQVQATDGAGQTDAQNIAVTVTNIADEPPNNAPVITSNGAAATASLEVVENSTYVTWVQVIDVDLNETLSFSIAGGADAARFTLTPGGWLNFATAPDFAAPNDAGSDNVYDVQIRVTDSGGLSDLQDIAVTVTPVQNWNAPVITSSGAGPNAAVTVLENAWWVTSVETQDPDAGDTQTYSLSGGADLAKFTIDEWGDLYFTEPPQFASPTDAGGDNVYDVQVNVTDSGGLSDVQDLAVTVSRINSISPPVITSNGGGTSAALSVAENSPLLTVVQAIDPDLGDSRFFSLSGGADSARFWIDWVAGTLYFDVAADFENPADAGGDNVYDVQVRVSDTGGLSDTQDIAVTVTASNANNGNAPVILGNGAGAAAAVSVAENSTWVTYLNGVDADPGDTLTLSLSGGADRARFVIDPWGNLFFVTAPDFEAPSDLGGDNIYDVQVTVTDSSGLSDVQDLAVTVTRFVSANAPIITSNGAGPTAALQVADNDSYVTAVQVTDPDPGDTRTYSLAGGADMAKFIVNEGGDLSFIAAPRFATPADSGGNNVYDVQVKVTDSGGLSDVQDLAVTVIPFHNANAPIITSNGAGPTAALNLTENRTYVTAVAITDPDRGDWPTFSLSGGADMARFTLDQWGDLYFATAPDFETPTDFGGDNVYEVQVTVTDRGGLTDVQNLAVTVGNLIDETLPTIIGASFNNAANASITVTFSEVVIGTQSGVQLTQYAAGSAPWGGTQIALTGVQGLGSDTVTFATQATLGATDHVRARYDASFGDVTDLAGNLLPTQEMWIGGSGATVIDLGDYGSDLPITLRGNGGPDLLFGSDHADTLVDGGGADVLSGREGVDLIRLVENGGSLPYARDVVRIELDASVGGAIDRVTGSLATGSTGFDSSSPTIADHDVLDLPSLIIAANVLHADGSDVGALARHSISSGIVTFESAASVAIPIDHDNLWTALDYLAQNLTSVGASVGFAVDTDSSGSADALYVFQDGGTVPLAGGHVLPDIVVRLDGATTGVNLGTTAGDHVLQLQDTQAPEVEWAVLTADGFALDLSESAFATTGLALSLQKNGVGPVFAHPSSVEGNGSSSLTLHYSGLSLAPEDWVMVSYTATAAANGFRDAAGNVALAENDDELTAEGGSGANTIDLSGLGAGYEWSVYGNAGDDRLIGSPGSDEIRGGSGADVLTGHAGNDEFDFRQGDSPLVAFADAAGVGLGTGDTFTFAGGQADLITDFGIGDELSFDTRFDDDGVLSRDPAWMATPSDGLASDQALFLVQGNFAAGVFTVDSATGADTLLVYDGDESAAATQTGVVLTGVTPSQLDLFGNGGTIQGV